MLVIALITVMVMAGCSKKSSSSSGTQVLSGAYKTPSKTEDGTSQPDYWYFKKDGKLLYCSPQVDSTNKNSDTDYWYGDAKRGTWRSLGNNKFQIKMHDVYDHDYFTLTGKLEGNKFHTYANSKKAKYRWYADTSTKQSKMTYSDYLDMFNKAKESDQKAIEENGYTKPDHDSSSDNSSTSDDDSQMTFEKAAQIIQKGGFTDFNYDRDSQTHDGSHATSNGGYLMITYP